MSDSPRPASLARRFFSQIKPYRRLLFLATFCGIMKFNLPLVFPWSFKILIDQVLLSSGPIPNRVRLLSEISLLLVGACFFHALFTYYRHSLGGKVGHQFIFDLRFRLYEHIQKMSLSFFEKNKTGSIISYVINDINIAQNLVGNAISNTFMDCSVLITVLFILFSLNAKLALVSILIFPFYAWSSHKLNPKIRETSKEVQEKLEQLSGELHERIAGIKVVKSFAREKTETDRFYTGSRGYFENIIEGVQLQSRAHMIAEFLVKLGPVVVFWYGGVLYLKGDLTLGSLMAFYGYLGAFYLPLTRLTELNVILQNSIVALERVFDLFDTKQDVLEKKNAAELKITEARVTFDHVSFGYEKGRKVICDVHAEARGSSIIALVGSSGAGKSTLMNLLLRFYDTTEGSIQIDGAPIRDVTVKSLRNQIGIVLQETVLFSGSVEENIRYGRLKATPEEVIAAAKAANAHEFILRMHDGYQSEVGERGNQISVGQKQRIAIARVFLKNPKIVILDEATSALDSVSEHFVQQALANLLKNRTTFVIAHRLSTILNAHEIWVMDQGRIVQKGSHRELVQQAGIYQEIYAKQFQSEKENVLEENLS